MERAARLAAGLAALAGTLGIAGCAQHAAQGGPSRVSPRAETKAVDGMAVLRARAEREATTPDTRAMEMPPPADVGPVVIEALPDDGSLRAVKGRMTLEAALATLTPAPAAAAPEPHEADPAAVRLYVSGRTKLLAGDAPGAVKDLEAAAKIDPHAGAVWRELGEAHLEAGRRAAASQSFRKALALGLREGRVLAVLGRESLRAERHAEAAAMLVEAQSRGLAPGLDVAAAVDLSEALAKLGYLRASRDALEEGLRAQGSIARARFRVEAAEVFRQRADLWARAGNASMTLGDFERAVHAYQEAVAAPGGDRRVLLPRAVYAGVKLGRPAGVCVRLIDDARAAGGRIEDWEARLLTYASRAAGMGEEAAAALDEVGREVGATPSVSGRLARARAELSARSREALRDQVLANPGDVETAAALFGAVALGDVKGRLEEAVLLTANSPLDTGVYAELIVARGQDVRAVVTFLGEDKRGAARLLHAVLLSRLGLPDQAVHQLDPARFDASLLGGVLAARVSAANAAGQMDVAADSLTRLAAMVEAGDAGARVALATAHMASRRPTEARDVLRPLVEGDARPGVELLLMAANAAASAGDGAAAEALLSATLECDRFDARVYEGLVSLYSAGGALTNERKLGEAARAFRAALPENRLMKFLGAQEQAARSLWESASDSLLRLLDGPVEGPAALGLAVTVWERAASGSPDLTARGEAWLRGRLAQRPEAVGLTMALARVLTAQGKAAEAEAMLAESIATWPMPEVGRLQEAVVREGLDDPARADALARARLERSPRTTENAIELAEALMQAGEVELAATTLANAVPPGAVLRPEQVQQLLALLSRLRPETFVAKGGEAADSAIRLIDLVASRGVPMSPGLHLARLMLLAAGHAEETDRLIAAVEEMAANQPDLRLRVYAQVAGTLSQREDATAVIRFLAVGSGKFEPRHPQLMSEAFRLTVVRGDYEDARWLIEETPEPEPLLTMIQSQGGTFEIPADPRQHRATLAYVVGSNLSSLGKDEQAVAVYRLGLRLWPTHAWTCNNLGYYLLESGGDLAEAEALIETAYSEMPHEFSIADSLAWVRYKRGKLRDAVDEAGVVVEQGAVSLLRRALEELNGEMDPTIVDHYGDALWRTGEKQAANARWAAAAGLLTDEVSAWDHRPQRQDGDREPPQTAKYRQELDAVRAKLAAVENGREPAVAPLAGE